MNKYLKIVYCEFHNFDIFVFKMFSVKPITEDQVHSYLKKYYQFDETKDSFIIVNKIIDVDMDEVTY